MRKRYRLVLAVIAYFILNRHRAGNRFFAVGGNAEAARSVGINVYWTKMTAFVICSLFATVDRAGGRLGAQHPDACTVGVPAKVRWPTRVAISTYPSAASFACCWASGSDPSQSSRIDTSACRSASNCCADQQ